MAAVRQNWILLVILAVAAVLRIWHLDDSLWYDEILTLTQSVRLSPFELLTTFGSLNNHILYTWLAKLSISVFGEHAWSVRLPAAIFGVASIWATWRLMVNLGYKTEAYVVAALLAVSYHHVWFSQNARGYTMMLFLLMWGSIKVEEAMRTRSLKTWTAYGLIAALALLTHLSAVFVLIGQGIMILWLQSRRSRDGVEEKRDIIGPVVAVVVCACLCLVVFGPLIPDIMSALNNVATPEPAQGPQNTDIQKWRNPLWTLAETLASFGTIGAILPIAAGLIMWGAFKLCQKSPTAMGGVFLSIPICLMALVLGHMRIWPRYFFVDIGILLSALVVGSFALAEFSLSASKRFLKGEPYRLATNPAAEGWIKGLGVGMMMVASIALLTGNYAAPKQNFTGAYAFVQSARASADKVVTVGLARVAYHDYLDVNWAPVETADAMSPRDGKTWVVVAFPDHMRKHYPEISATLDQDYRLVRRFKGTLSEGDILVYRSNAQRPAT